MLVRLAVLASTVALVACGARRIPGTEIRETADTRAVFDVVQEYTKALQDRDAQRILALVSPQYFDTAGTPDPADDLDYQRLGESLASDLQKLEAIRVEMTLREIAVEGNRARADVFYDTWYRVQTPSGIVPRRDSDLHRFQLVKADGAWRIVSGI